MPDSHRPNWDDIRFVLAVAETGTVSGAARLLQVNHATVLRRIAAVEGRYGLQLFVKTATGYGVRPDRLQTFEAFRDIESAMLSAENMMRGVAAPMTGSVRITSTDTLCQMVLAPILARFQGRGDKLKLALLSNNAHIDFSRAQADISVRPAKSLSEGLSGEIVASLAQAVYHKPGCTDAWLTPDGPLGRSLAAQWMAQHVPGDVIRGSSDSFLVLGQMAGAGLGRVILPCIVGRSIPGLEQVDGLPPIAPVPVWVACHDALAGVPRIALAMAILSETLSAQNDVLSDAN
ncbi:MAG: LysR family transcriptional regulator [Pseudomonadota bacterium]